MSLVPRKIGSNRPTRTQRLLCNSDAPCAFTGYRCSLARAEGYEYCSRHILEDKTAPVRQCRYVFPNSKRCFRSAPLGERRESLCPEHSRQAWRKRQKSSLRKRPPKSPESCLSQLSHHEKPSISDIENYIPDPANVPSVSATVLLYGSHEEDSHSVSELDVRLLPRAEDDSELDSADSEADHLEHAGVFTTEEVSRIYLQKLHKMKGLYTEEFKRLQYILKENRRDYLRAVKSEKETMMNIHSQPKPAPEERETYEELKFLSKFHRHVGIEALLYKQNVEKRLQATEGITPKSSSFVKCIYSEGSWRCGLKSVPLSKYCFKHILQDERQVLFQPCGSLQPGGEECLVPVVPLPPHEPMCVYHTSFPSPLELSDLLTDTTEEPRKLTLSTDLLVDRTEEPRKFTSSNPKIVEFSDSNSFLISEVLPEDSVMEGHLREETTNKKCGK